MNLIELDLPVVRDADGYWSNPAIPDFDEDAKAYKLWIEAQGLETTYRDLEFEDADHPAYVKYFDDGDADISEWTPEQPEGEGWHTLTINAHEDGVCWVWARRILKSANVTGSRNKREGRFNPEMHFRGQYVRGNAWPIYYRLTRQDRKAEHRASKIPEWSQE